MNEYFIYSYLEAIEYRYQDYKNANELDKNDFDTGIVKAFNNAIAIMKKLLQENDLLEGYIDDRCAADLNISVKHLVEIIKHYITDIQKLYNNLFGKKDLPATGEMFGYYATLDILEIDIKTSDYEYLFADINITIPISLDKKVDISEL